MSARMHSHRPTDDYPPKHFNTATKPVYEPKIMSALSSNRRMPTLLEIENFQSQGNPPTTAAVTCVVVTQEKIKKLAEKFNEKKVNSTASKNTFSQWFSLLASINYQHFKECIQSEFRNVPLPEHFIRAFFDRFRPFKPKENATEIELAAEMDIVDFLLAVNLLSTIPLDAKVKCNVLSRGLICCSYVRTLRL